MKLYKLLKINISIEVNVPIEILIFKIYNYSKKHIVHVRTLFFGNETTTEQMA